MKEMIRLVGKAPVAILLILLLVSFAYGQEEKTKGPKIAGDNLSFDFAEVDEGAPVTHTYIIKNLGSEDLKIEKVQPG